MTWINIELEVISIFIKKGEGDEHFLLMLLLGAMEESCEKKIKQTLLTNIYKHQNAYTGLNLELADYWLDFNYISIQDDLGSVCFLSWCKQC